MPDSFLLLELTCSLASPAGQRLFHWDPHALLTHSALVLCPQSNPGSLSKCLPITVDWGVQNYYSIHHTHFAATKLTAHPSLHAPCQWFNSFRGAIAQTPYCDVTNGATHPDCMASGRHLKYTGKVLCSLKVPPFLHQDMASYFSYEEVGRIYKEPATSHVN
jgi:hypothetical protein